MNPIIKTTQHVVPMIYAYTTPKFTRHEEYGLYQEEIDFIETHVKEMT